MINIKSGQMHLIYNPVMCEFMIPTLIHIQKNNSTELTMNPTIPKRIGIVSMFISLMPHQRILR